MVQSRCIDRRIKFFMEIPYPVAQKIIISGRYVEHYTYEKPYWVGFPRFRLQHRFVVFQKPKVDQTQIRDDNVRRTRIKIRRLVNSNQDLDRFMTLTFNTPELDLVSANPKFNDFILRVRFRFPDFKYLCVPEFQKKSARVHYHLLCNIPFINSDELVALWGHGFVFIRKVDSVDNLGAYVCKYLGKANFDTRYFRKKKFFYSYNLLRAVVVDKFEEVVEVLKNLPLQWSQFIKKVFEFDFETKYLGMISYKQYKMAEHMVVSGSPPLSFTL